MALNFTGDEIELRDQANIAFTIAHHLPVAFHRIQAANKPILLAICNFQLVCNIVGVGGNAKFGENLQNQFSARDGIFIFRAFAFNMRVKGSHQRPELIHLGGGRFLAGDFKARCARFTFYILRSCRQFSSSQIIFHLILRDSLVGVSLICPDGGIGRRTRFRS